jgi:hypothetical protein
MKIFKAAISLLLLSSVSVLAEEAAPPSTVSSLPMLATMTSGAKPAVDGVNGKVEIYGGAGQGNAVNISGIPGLSPAQFSTNWNGEGGAIGTITVPIGHSFGAQLDLGSGAVGNNASGAAAGHLFWRDPDKGLIGVYGDGLLLGAKVGTGVWTAAGEFEAYLGNFTGRAVLGMQGASFYTANLTRGEIRSYGGQNTFDQANYFTDIVSATFYPIDDLALSVGHIYSFGRNVVTGEVEYLLPQFRGGNIAPSAFISGAYGLNDASNIMAGIRVYFGNHDKTLIRRQREDDPVVYGAGAAGAASALENLKGRSQKSTSSASRSSCNTCNPSSCPPDICSGYGTPVCCPSGSGSTTCCATGGGR